MTTALRLQRVQVHCCAISRRLAVSRPLKSSAFCRPSRAETRAAGLSPALRRAHCRREGRRDRMTQRRVAVTGAGVVSPLGCTLEDFHRALCDARPGVRRLAPEIVQGSGVQVGALTDWKPAALLAEGEAANL